MDEPVGLRVDLRLGRVLVDVGRIVPVERRRPLHRELLRLRLVRRLRGERRVVVEGSHDRGIVKATGLTTAESGSSGRRNNTLMF